MGDGFCWMALIWYSWFTLAGSWNRSLFIFRVTGGSKSSEVLLLIRFFVKAWSL